MPEQARQLANLLATRRSKYVDGEQLRARERRARESAGKIERSSC
jgi:hypothetical protein